MILTSSEPFQGKCKIVSDFQGRRSETRPDRIRKMFDPEIEESFPLYTTMKKIHAMDSCPSKTLFILKDVNDYSTLF